jgi:regulator of sigma E protease
MNIVIAILAVTISLAIGGMTTSTIEATSPGSPAEAAGLAAGDKIIEISGHEIDSWNDVIDAINAYKEGDGELEVVYLRDGEEHTAQMTPEFDAETQRYMIGITSHITRDPVKCISNGVKSTWELNKMMLSAFASIFKRGISRDDVSGPVGLVKVVNETSSYGIVPYLMLLSLVSLNLALFNIIPIPGLDGGKIFFILLKVISGGRITDDMEYKATLVGMALLLTLFILVTVNDVRNLFG